MSIYAILSGTGFLVAANLHGKERTGKYNFWHTFLAGALVYPLLILGGFFN